MTGIPPGVSHKTLCPAFSKLKAKFLKMGLEFSAPYFCQSEKIIIKYTYIYKGYTMTDISVVTTFHGEGLDLYAQRFLNSFAEKVDKKIRLVAYAENCSPTNPDENQIEILKAETALPKLQQFKKTWGDVPKANGKCPFPEKRPRDYHKEFKWDAVRFANKVYAVFDACTRSQGWVVWMDADMYVHSDWNYPQWLSLLPKDAWIAYVGRGKGSATWPECGFYGINLQNKTARNFIQEFENYYENAEEGIFTLDEWHDSYVFGHILNMYKDNSAGMLDYTENTILQTAKTGGGGHPLINTELGKYIDHLKGNRKKLGKSKLTDISVNRNEDYWK
jgi:hypothetical protein